MAKKRAGDDLLDGLYAAAPREFVAERKRVREALVAEGRDDEARQVAKRKRPSASVWAVNQLARRAPDDVAELLDLGASLRAGERKLMRGGDAAGFMEDARTARQKVAGLAKRAEAYVAEAGQKPTVTLARKIAQTLQAASIADEETRERLAAGRLDEDLTPPSTFGSEGPIPARRHAPEREAAHARPREHTHASKRERAAAEHKPAAADRKSAAADRKLAAAERKRAAAELRDQRRAQAAARKHAAALERAATAAERVVVERQRAVERARASVERAEAALRAAKDELVDAETAATAARRAADDAAR